MPNAMPVALARMMIVKKMSASSFAQSAHLPTSVFLFLSPLSLTHSRLA